MARSFWCCLVLLCSDGCTAGIPPASAQAQARPEAAKSLLARVAPSPTGRNGYEELLRAADLVESSRVWKRVEQQGDLATLAVKRRVLQEKPIVQALALVRQGLNKPVFSPREFDKLTYETLLPELGPFRSMARLLKVQQYVFLADGKTPEALGNARQGLRLGRVVQTDTLISGLVGIAISTICVRSLGDHLDQLSARDCETLFQVCIEWLQQPSLHANMLAMERDHAKRNLALIRDDFKKRGLPALQDVFGLDKDEWANAAPILDQLKSPESIDRLAAEADEKLDAFYERQLAQTRKPRWERSYSDPKQYDDASPSGWVVKSLAPAMNRVDDAYGREEAHVRVLACHAAIRRYRWEHGKLPGGLAELNLGELAIDPFTGQPLQYEIKGRRYRLASVGALADADDPNAVNGRRPVSITPD